jgi:hypothetical protein
MPYISAKLASFFSCNLKFENCELICSKDYFSGVVYPGLWRQLYICLCCVSKGLNGSGPIYIDLLI